MEITTIIVTAETAAIVIAAVVAAETTVLTIAAEVTAVIVTTEITTIIVTTEIATIIIAAEATALVTFAVTTEIAVVATLAIAAVITMEITTVVITTETTALTVAAEVTAVVITTEFAVFSVTMLIARVLPRLAFMGAESTVSTWTILMESTVTTEAAFLAESSAFAILAETALMESAGLAVRFAEATMTVLAVTIPTRGVTFSIVAVARLEAFSLTTRLESSLAAWLETVATATGWTTVAITLMSAAVRFAGTLVSFCHMHAFLHCELRIVMLAEPSAIPHRQTVRRTRELTVFHGAKRLLATTDQCKTS